MIAGLHASSWVLVLRNTPWGCNDKVLQYTQQRAWKAYCGKRSVALWVASNASTAEVCCFTVVACWHISMMASPQTPDGRQPIESNEPQAMRNVLSSRLRDTLHKWVRPISGAHAKFA